MRRALIIGLAAAAALLLESAVHGRCAPSAKGIRYNSRALGTFVPAKGTAAHRVGRMVLACNNDGTFGYYGLSSPPPDFFTGDPQVPRCEYPKGSNTRYLYAGVFWIGAVVDSDTLVSTGAEGWGDGDAEPDCTEFSPDEAPFGYMKFRSTIDPNVPEYEGAVSEEDFVAVYTDTVMQGLKPDFFDGRIHQPLGIEVTEASYAWSYPYADDIVLFDYQVKNIGTRTLSEVYMGIYVDADIHWKGKEGAADDLGGFVLTMPALCGKCEYLDTVYLAWTADNDGDLVPEVADDVPVPHVTATRIVRTPADNLDVSFNWWASDPNPTLDFGPRERAFAGELDDDVRNFGTGGLGTPFGDANKYYVMRNREFDYDQAFTGTITGSDHLWLEPPPEAARTIPTGMDTRYLLSFGPFDIHPGNVLPVSFAYVGGENFHTQTDNSRYLKSESYDPEKYYSNLDFSDLGLNARWASWIYDNPGVDTDGDGYAGEPYICRDPTDSTLVDTCWIKGDGVPDFRGAAPPPAPDMWITPSPGRITVRLNGLRSETARDIITGLRDFEGYRVYLARDDRASSYSLIASYDIEDYRKWVWVESERDWHILDPPFSLGELRCLYGTSCDDSAFNPLHFTRHRAYRHPLHDSLFYFTAQDKNAWQYGVTTPIRKRFPGQQYPSNLDPRLAQEDELTADGYLRYFEYEYEIVDLLPTVAYWVSVTAFDFGAPESGISPLETALTLNTRSTYPLSSADEVARQGKKVFVYPNPYRIDGGYRSMGFEGRSHNDRPDDRVREVHFANLPPNCVIRIFSLDGDLIRELIHDYAPSDPNAAHHTWNMITRNTQMVVSGLYYWTVEDRHGQVQIGKLMIIM